MGPVLGVVAIATSVSGPLLVRFAGLPQEVMILLALVNLGVFLAGFPVFGVLAGRAYAKREMERTGYSVPMTDGAFAGVRMALVAAGMSSIVTLLLAAVLRDEMLPESRMPCFDPRTALGGGLASLVCSFVCTAVIGRVLASAGGALGARWVHPGGE